MTTITKTIDLRIPDYEVELELDASDLEDFDAEELWGALQEVCSSSDIADLVTSEQDVLEAVLDDCDNETLTGHIDLASFKEEMLDAMTTDERKEACGAWVNDGSTDDALATFLREQLGATSSDEPLGEKVRLLLLAAPMTDILRCMMLQKGVGAVASTAVAVAFEDRES